MISIVRGLALGAGLGAVMGVLSVVGFGPYHGDHLMQEFLFNSLTFVFIFGCFGAGFGALIDLIAMGFKQLAGTWKNTRSRFGSESSVRGRDFDETSTVITKGST